MWRLTSRVTVESTVDKRSRFSLGVVVLEKRNLSRRSALADDRVYLDHDLTDLTANYASLVPRRDAEAVWRKTSKGTRMACTRRSLF